MEGFLMKEKITSKEQMYSLLNRGLLGNTTNQYFSIEDWKNSAEYKLYKMWGIRGFIPGGPCFLYVPSEDVESIIEQHFTTIGYNISLMIDAYVTKLFDGEVFMGDYGLELYGILNPPKGYSWRVGMPTLGRTYRHTMARCILNQVCDPNSLNDIYELLDAYPEHIIEFSACDRKIGMFPNRKVIIWEVRCSTGEYEQATWKQHKIVPQRGWSKIGD
jgi:hypothetical protein